MGTKRTQTRNRQKKRSWLPAAAAVLACVAAAMALLPRHGEDSPAAGQDVQVIAQGERLVIPVEELSTTARFYPVEVDGTRMELIAVKDTQGKIRTAFNTCQICYSSGRGYYVQDGAALVCQNCGNRFTIDQVEVESGGCNPWPIFSADKTVTEESVSISYDYLSAATRIFANWKANF